MSNTFFMGGRKIFQGRLRPPLRPPLVTDLYSISVLIVDLTCFKVENVRGLTHVGYCMCFQTSSAYLVRTLSVWEIYFC